MYSTTSPSTLNRYGRRSLSLNQDSYFACVRLQVSFNTVDVSAPERARSETRSIQTCSVAYKEIASGGLSNKKVKKNALRMLVSGAKIKLFAIIVMVQVVEAADSRLPRFGGKGNGDGSPMDGSTMAELANALDVYEDAVQEPLLECSNLASMYYQAQLVGSVRPEAKILREDFCSSGQYGRNR